MKDKNRITLMVCISASGALLPVSVIGTAARPECFKLLDNSAKTPLSYHNQANAWFDKQVTNWWLRAVFASNKSNCYSYKPHQVD
jgi:hypothetical protein